MSRVLERALLEEIRSHGPISFATYMERALYDPDHGYYSRDRARTGWDGHYLTSPEIDPAFGHLWANAVREVWKFAGKPDDFAVIEVGPGEAGFAAALIDGLRATELWERTRLVLVERNAGTEKRQRERLGDDERLSWRPSLAGIREPCGIVIAHEVLDNVPLHLVRRDAGVLVELLVGEERGALELVPAPLDPSLAAHVEHLDIVEGARAEVSPQRQGFARSCVDALDRGAVAFIDYGLDRRGWAAHPGGTVVCYSDTGTDDAPLERPGEKDITGHVDWTAVASGIDGQHRMFGPFDQRSVLKALGLGDIDRSLRDEHDRAIGEKRGADALRALSRRQALGALADPAGLGGLQVLFALTGIPEPSFIRGI